MRFRLATSGAGGGGQELAGGVGNLFRSISMAPAVAAQAAEEARAAQGQLNLQSAQTALYQGKAGEIADQRERSTPGAMLQTAMSLRGVPLHQQGDYGNFLRTGQKPAQYSPPADGVGPVMPAPKIYEDDTAQRILQTLGLGNTALAVGDSNSLNIAKAAGEYQDQDVMGAAVEAARGGNDMFMSRLNTVRGKKEFTPFAAVGDTGTALNQITGDQDVTNQGLRAIFGNKAAAEIEQKKASAGASRASAASSYASAAKTNQERELGSKGTLQQTDQGLLLVDPRTGVARAVIGPDGKPAGAKPTGGGSLNENQANALNFANRMAAANDIFDDLSKSGVKRPGLIKSAAEGIAGAVPLVGESLSAGASAATNWTQSAKQQQVEQAQRDFINAVLRRESGAAIADSEFASGVKQYFPALGDSPEVIAQKRANRQRAQAGILAAVPETMRTVPKSPANAGSGASGSWEAPAAAPGGWSITRVE